jgi:O-antigen ligase
MYGTIISILYRLFRGGLQELIKVFSGVNILHVDMLGLIVGANIFSIALIVSFFISIYYYIVSKNKLYILYSILFFAMMILSGSRKVYLSLFIVVLWFLITNFRKIKPRTILFVVLISALGFIFLVSSDLFSYSINRFRGFINLFIGGEDVDISTLVRIEMIQEGFSAFSRRPLVGYGFGYIEEILTPRFLGFSSYLHNNYIELLVSVGLLGFICFYYMYFSFFKKLRKINEISKPLYLIFIIVLLSTDLAMATYRLKITFLIIPFIDSYIRINLKNKRKEVA